MCLRSVAGENVRRHGTAWRNSRARWLRHSAVPFPLTVRKIALTHERLAPLPLPGPSLPQSVPLMSLDANQSDGGTCQTTLKPLFWHTSVV